MAFGLNVWWGRPIPMVMARATRERVAASAALGGRRRRRWLLVAAVCAGLFVGLAVSAASALMWRSNVRAQERQAFVSEASGVTATLGTLLRRDVDFVATLRAVLTLQPHMSATAFNAWYRTLADGQRQVEGIGSAVVSLVPAGQLAAFQARRDADPAFRTLLGRWLMQVPRGPEARYCLLASGGELVPVTAVTARLVQEDWCLPDSEVGLFQAPLLQSAAVSGLVLVSTVDVPVLQTTFLETAFYHREAPSASVADRRAAVAGWVVSSFDMPAVIAAAIGHLRGLSIDLYHSNPGEPRALVGSVGPGDHAGELELSRGVWIDGAWTIVAHGRPVMTGMGADEQAWLVFAAGAVMAVLLLALVLVLARSRERALRMVAEKTAQLRHQALHDALTGLPNRRALIAELDAQLARVDARELMLALFDLDGFKEYNDTFGHLAGDALLTRLGDHLAQALEGIGTAYRMGGDEFCVLAESGEHEGVVIAARAASALSEPGEAFTIGCSYGIARIPRDGSSPADALRVADDRMYEHKTSRVSAGRQSADVLRKALDERDPELTVHLSEVATLARMTAQRLGLADV